MEPKADPNEILWNIEQALDHIYGANAWHHQPVIKREFHSMQGKFHTEATRWAKANERSAGGRAVTIPYKGTSYFFSHHPHHPEKTSVPPIVQ